MRKLTHEEIVARQQARMTEPFLPFSAVRELKEGGSQIVLLEQTDRSVPYHRFIPRKPVCLVIGNEIEGVSDGLTRLCDAAVDIDMAGVKNSLNVAVAFGVVAYHIRHSLLR